ncbi:ATP-binding protein [Paucidesulfovibrio longus]|uniref:ATP-binding protein n=1 Tax=Paucidesulfovibrio longus TaxID=889 RepID=UPI0003B3E590|nr:ATP-binding protein [Paucidesulfovibrio longus]
MRHWEQQSIGDLLQHLFMYDESDRIEVKTGSEIGKSILETVIAFANEPNLGGGYLILGIAENADSPSGYEVVGVDDPDKLKNDLTSQCRSSLNVAVQIHSWAETIDGKTVLAFYVAEADPNQKPVYRAASGLPKGAYRRGPSGDIRCVDQDLQELYRQKSATEFDTTIPVDAEMEDIDPDAVAIYRAERANANPNAEELGWDDDELLRSLSCARKVQGILKPTIAGILLFGKQSALRRLMPAVRVDYIRISGREWVEDPNHRFDTVDLRDSLFRLIRRSVAAVMDDLPKSFNLPTGELARKDRPVLPVDVVRESVVNALMHRNYQKHQPVQIIRYANRLEIRNPGHSLKPTEQLGEPGSVVRNPALAAVLHETHLAETKGSGIRVMRTLMEQAGLELPQFESDRHGDEFRATYLFHHFLSEQDVEWLGRFRHLNPTNEQSKALVYARETGSVSNSAYRDLNKVHFVEASHDLCQLRDLGVLESKGAGRGTYYVLSDKFTSRPRLPSLFDTLETTSPRSADSHGDMTSQPTKSGAEPLKLDTKPLKLDGTSDAMESIRSNCEEALGISADKSPRGDDVKRIILYLCGQQPFSAKQLAGILKKNPQYLAKEYLSAMVRVGELELMFPDAPKHPKQAYRAKRVYGGMD